MLVVQKVSSPEQNSLTSNGLRKAGSNSGYIWGCILNFPQNKSVGSTWAMKKKTVTFYYTGCLIAVLMMVYYNTDIIG